MARLPLLELLELHSQSVPDQLVAAVRELLAGAGLGDARFYLADYSQHSLRPLSGGGPPLDIDSTAAGRAYRQMSAHYGDRARRQLWLPLLDHGSRLGVLGVRVDPDSGLTERELQRLADLVTMMLVSARLYSDQTHRTRRATPLEMGTELRWDLLPPLSLFTPALCLAGMLEPAYEVAGDAFDYAFDDGVAHFAVLDAVGHGLEASSIVNLVIGAYRNQRREGADLVALYRYLDDIVVKEFASEKFVTAHLGELDITEGRLSWIAAGQPPPLLLRRGRSHDLQGVIVTPVGMGFTVEPEVTTHQLEPQDTLVFFSDGVTEARSGEGELFGRQALRDLLTRAAHSHDPATEMVRRLVHAVLDHVGAPLSDDATVLALQWRPDEL